MNRTRLLSALAGLLIAAGLPPWGWWPLTIVGIGLWFQLIDHAAPRTRFGRSLIVGVFWFYPSTVWMLDLTAPGWPFAAALFALMAALVGWATPPDRPSRRIIFPAALALAELVRWSWPLGGVPISTLAMVGVDTPFGIAARLLGSAFLVMLVAVAGVGALDLARRNGRAVIAALAFLAAATIGGHLAGSAVEAVGEVRVAVVQGGGPQNTRADLCQNRSVFERHMTASDLISEPVDLILWPEDVVHVTADGATSSRCAEPLLSQTEAEERLRALATETGATLITGWFHRSEDGLANVNYSLVIGPEGDIGDRYDKVRLVPFGEYVPLRSLIDRFSDELPLHDVRAGTEPAVLDTDLGRFGISISWEIFFDHRARDAIGNGGLALLNPTNGSSYWLTIVQSQQIASSRLRAIETDRWVLQAAPTGFSAVVSPEADVRQRTGVGEPAVLIDTIELREGRTVAVVVGAWPILLVCLAVIGLGRRRDANRWFHRRFNRS